MQDAVSIIEDSYYLVFGKKPDRAQFKCTDREYLFLLKESMSMNKPVENIQEVILPKKVKIKMSQER